MDKLIVAKFGGSAIGVDGEGLQIGEGEIDFSSFAKLYYNCFGEATWIPEVWQGHKDYGSGFKQALKKLSENGW